MKLRELVLCLVIGAGCATTTTTSTTAKLRLLGGVELAQRVYALPEAKAQQLVQEALEKHGLQLLPTEDPHVLMTPVRKPAVPSLNAAELRDSDAPGQRC